PGTARQTRRITTAIARDARAAGTDRADLLAAFAARPGSMVHLIPDGFGLARNGRRAAQVGPVVAASDADAITILSALFDRIRGAIFIDVPDRCTGTLDWLRRQGFTLARRFTRMALGRTRP